MSDEVVPLADGRDIWVEVIDGVETMVVRTQSIACAMLGVNRRTLAEWLSLGAPGRPGRYVVAELLWWDVERKAGGKVCRECLRVYPKGTT